jgi:carbon monoxide dehydrogenase subunit G
MQLEHEFTVPVPAPDAWRVLLDLQRIAPCMPGATIERVEGDEFTGRIKVKLGPIMVSYYGTARFVEKDEAGRRFVLEGNGRETRGAGTASATITGRLHEQQSSTRVTVTTDLDITGKPAQFGRGVLADVAANLLDRFATCLADRITASPTTATPATEEQAAAQRVSVGGAQGDGRSMDSEAGTLDLIGTVGLPVLRRLTPALAGLAAVLGWLVARRARSRVVVHVHLPAYEERTRRPWLAGVRSRLP